MGLTARAASTVPTERYLLQLETVTGTAGIYTSRHGLAVLGATLEAREEVRRLVLNCGLIRPNSMGIGPDSMVFTDRGSMVATELTGDNRYTIREWVNHALQTANGKK